MKITYFCNEVSRKNGWCVINYYTVKEAVGAGHKVIVFTDSEADNIQIGGVTYYPILFKVGKIRDHIKNFFMGFLRVRQILSSERPDIVHILVEPYLIYFSILKHRHLVLTIVGTYAVSIFEKSGLRFLYKLALKKTQHLVAISDYTVTRFKRLIQYQKQISVVTLGVDLEAFSLNPLAAQTEKELSFCFVGHIKPRKGLIYALKATAILRNSVPHFKFYVAGLFEDEAYSRFCSQFVQDNQLEENVQFMGRLSQEDIRTLYSKSILNLLPSYNTPDGSFEGFGLIHLEANAVSTLTLGSKDTGNESAIVDGVTGFLVSQENEHELASKMKQVIDIFKQGQYDWYAKKCVEHAKENSWDRYFKKLETVYLETIK